MKIKSTRESHLRPAIAHRAGALPIAVLLVTGALTGCGSDEGGAFKEFVGVWELDFEKELAFDLTCPAPNAAESGSLPLWGSQMVIEEGTVTDLIETAGLCQFNFNVTGKIASIPDPDPFTGESPVCRLGASDIPGARFADIRPAWEFRLLAPEKGKAPTAQLVALTPVATLTFVAVVAGVPTPDPPCTYAAQANLIKIAQF